MPAYATQKLEFSPDALSDTTPSWIDVSRYCISSTWQGGKARDLDAPQAGGATFVLKNSERRFEPEYVAGAYYPNIRPMRRFRLSIISGGVTTQQGIYYATSWAVSYPAGTDYSIVTVTCVDGFGVMSNANLPAMNPKAATSLADVQAYDQPFAQFLLDDGIGTTKMVAATGTDGVYKGVPPPFLGQQPPMVPGDSGSSVIFGVAGAAGIPSPQYGRSPVSDTNQFTDTDTFTIEAVVANLTYPASPGWVLRGPYRTANGDYVFGLNADGFCFLYTGIGVTTSLPATGTDSNVHHLAVSWDGNTLRSYRDGVLVGSKASGGSLITGDANEYLRVGADPLGTTPAAAAVQISHACFYETCLPAARIAAHATAALSRGRVAETVGDRLAALAANPLWGTTHIPPSQLLAEPRMFAGQTTVDEIVATVAAEQPIGLFYFRDDGDPAYYGWDDTRLVAPVAIFGDQGGEIHYTAIDLQYDDVLYNDVASGRDGGQTFDAIDAASQAEFGGTTSRAFDATSLLLAGDDDAKRVGQAILDRFSQPSYSIDSITLNGATPGALTHILNREIGDTIRVRRRGTGGTAIDIITQILGKSKTFDVNGNLTCTWSLASGFNAATSGWRLGVSGYSELGSTTVLG